MVSKCSLLENENTVDFCLVTFCPMTLLNSHISSSNSSISFVGFPQGWSYPPQIKPILFPFQSGCIFLLSLIALAETSGDQQWWEQASSPSSWPQEKSIQSYTLRMMLTVSFCCCCFVCIFGPRSLRDLSPWPGIEPSHHSERAKS